MPDEGRPFRDRRQSAERQQDGDFSWFVMLRPRRMVTIGTSSSRRPIFIGWAREKVFPDCLQDLPWAD